ncbi:MAG: DoxX family membrane protein [Oscillatoriales cyanobacterium SM2_1_8]|nr:DoxX family membrane protein [Oscillatoriales cyanobacterium SM2_1_8]
MNIRPAMLRAEDIGLAYFWLRAIVGVNYFNHGFVRLGNMTGFADAMVDRFKDTFLPSGLVWLTGLAVTPVEFVVGILLTVGWFTRSALVATLALMAVLMYGVTLLQDWSTASSQLVYDLILFVLLAGVGYNRWAIDSWLARRGSPRAEGEETLPNPRRRNGRRAALFP